MELKTLKLTEIIPYEKNPRYNEDAVEAVADSIAQCGYVQPILVDENNVILCGHTRHKALNILGYTEAQVTVISGLTEKQKKEYRLYDNKTAEVATWDYQKLIKELKGLDLGDFSYFDKDVEKMGDMLIKESNRRGKDEKIVICPNCGKMVKGPAVDVQSFMSDEVAEDE